MPIECERVHVAPQLCQRHNAQPHEAKHYRPVRNEATSCDICDSGSQAQCSHATHAATRAWQGRRDPRALPTQQLALKACMPRGKNVGPRGSAAQWSNCYLRCDVLDTEHNRDQGPAALWSKPSGCPPRMLPPWRPSQLHRGRAVTVKNLPELNASATRKTAITQSRQASVARETESVC